MSRRGTCHDNAVAECLFQLLKRERIRRKTDPTRDDARRDGFEYIALFYSPKRKHTNNGMLSPVDVEIRQQKLQQAGFWKTRGTSLVIRRSGSRGQGCRRLVSSSNAEGR